MSDAPNFLFEVEEYIESPEEVTLDTTGFLCLPLLPSDKQKTHNHFLNGFFKRGSHQSIESNEKRVSRILISKQAYFDIKGHAVSGADPTKLWSECKEMGGILVGQRQLLPDGTYEVVIVGYIPTESDGSLGEFSISKQEFAVASHKRHAQYPGTIVVGLYHTHPGHDADFYSATDQVNLGKEGGVLTEDFHVSIIMDPRAPRFPGGQVAIFSDKRLIANFSYKDTISESVKNAAIDVPTAASVSTPPQQLLPREKAQVCSTESHTKSEKKKPQSQAVVTAPPETHIPAVSISAPPSASVLAPQQTQTHWRDAMFESVVYDAVINKRPLPETPLWTIEFTRLPDRAAINKFLTHLRLNPDFYKLSRVGNGADLTFCTSVLQNIDANKILEALAHCNMEHMIAPKTREQFLLPIFGAPLDYLNHSFRCLIPNVEKELWDDRSLENVQLDHSGKPFKIIANFNNRGARSHATLETDRFSASSADDNLLEFLCVKAREAGWKNKPLTLGAEEDSDFAKAFMMFRRGGFFFDDATNQRAQKMGLNIFSMPQKRLNQPIPSQYLPS